MNIEEINKDLELAKEEDEPFFTCRCRKLKKGTAHIIPLECEPEPDFNAEESAENNYRDKYGN